MSTPSDRKAILDALLLGRAKKSMRASKTPITEFVAQFTGNGIGMFPYHNTKKATDHASYRSLDTRAMIERRIGPYFWTTGNWPQFMKGADAIAFWTDPKISKALEKAGFDIREQNTAAKNTGIGEPEGEPTKEQ